MTYLKEQTVLEVAQRLVRIPSVTTGENEAVTRDMHQCLTEIGFDSHVFEYTDQHGTTKFGLHAKREPSNTSSSGRGIGYFCHNDVVSVEGWDEANGGPFEARVADERLWGRGSCDMKGSAAAALTALAKISAADQSAPIYFFVTGDEECGMSGADLLAGSPLFQEMVDGEMLGVIGEPTSLQLVTAHKGACHIAVRTRGVAAHSSSDEGINANWQMIPFMQYLVELRERLHTEPQYLNDQFSPNHMSLNLVLSNFPAMANITVGESKGQIFFRPMTNTSWEKVIDEIREKAEELSVEVDVMRPLRPIETPSERSSVRDSLQLLGQSEPLSVCYATDGCCLDALQDIVVIGPGSIEQAHRPDEFIELSQLERGVEVFEAFFRKFACS